ncbi:hypothetical protein [Sorangium sp. So ce1078]|uniref:hypothetical protein n=1 Tax=Sorangium sp. So ce1078 TaxID=3133329 RepID=UPI003F5F429E
MRSRALPIVIAALSALGACLPSETRPEPGEVVYTLSGAADILGGVQSSDGWSIEFSRFLLAADGVFTDESSECDVVAMAYTPTIVDVRVPGKHEVNRVLAIGECGFSYYIGPVHREHHDDLEVKEWLGPGVTDQDLALLESLSAGVYVEGKATKAGVTKVFRWSFVSQDFCRPGFDEGAGEGSRATFRVGSGATERVDLAIRGDHLFFDRLDEAAAEVRFDPIAGADTDPAYGNADGEVTQEELSRVPLSAIERADGAYFVEGPVDLATWMYMRMAHVGHLGGTEACSSLDLE